MLPGGDSSCRSEPRGGRRGGGRAAGGSVFGSSRRPQRPPATRLPKARRARARGLFKGYCDAGGAARRPPGATEGGGAGTQASEPGAAANARRRRRAVTYSAGGITAAGRRRVLPGRAHHKGRARTRQCCNVSLVQRGFSAAAQGVHCRGRGAAAKCRLARRPRPLCAAPGGRQGAARR
ncbi:MAG: hypothetical protein J3K34DRAFT_426554 [Monoraphidium minutum]|nr:MAG: hypothetical protein J3K34DRAFT_426554 [Monoraphidium minutum]